MGESHDLKLPEECSQQWEVLLLLLASEEKKIDRTNDTEIETMTYFLHNEGIRKILMQWLHQMQGTYARKRCESDTALKCDDVSLLWRQRGNDKFRVNLVEESFRCYSKSVMYARQDGPMYRLALANRSASLLKMKRYQECLSDIELAIEAGYPVEQRHKLLVRRADCLAECGSVSEAREALSVAVNHAAKLTLDIHAQAEFDRHVKVVERKLEACMGDGTSAGTGGGEQPPPPPLLGGENPDFVAASVALELRRNESVGRHVIARSETRRGDVLFSEEPYAWVPLPDAGVCEGCCTPCLAVLPCATCSRASYCSPACRARALNAYHRWECAGAQQNLFETIGIAHLALRVLLSAAHEGLPPPPAAPSPTSARALLASYSRTDPVAAYRAAGPPFFRVYHLITNFDKMNNMDYTQYAITATLLTLYLEKYTSFLPYLGTKAPSTLAQSEVRLLAGALLLRALGQLVCNGHAALTLATTDDDSGEGRTVTEREVRRATAIYPSAAMMNHSCDSNIINTFQNSRLIIRCARDTAAGAEIVNCYGPHRARAATTRRRQLLRAQYMFTCLCAACTDTSRDHVSLFTAYACQSCRGAVSAGGARPRCPLCRADLELQRARDTLERADDLAHSAEQATSLAVRCERAHAALRLRQQVLHRHHTSLRVAADSLARLYADMGEFSKSVELIKQNIQSLEYQFGSFSVEVAHELRKLSDVMLERIVNSPQSPDYREWCLEAHKIIKKAYQLMELNYGAWEPVVKRLEEQQAFTAALIGGIAGAGASVHDSLHYNLKI